MGPPCRGQKTVFTCRDKHVSEYGKAQRLCPYSLFALVTNSFVLLVCNYTVRCLRRRRPYSSNPTNPNPNKAKVAGSGTSKGEVSWQVYQSCQVCLLSKENQTSAHSPAFDDIARLTGLTTLGVIAKRGSDGGGAGIVTLEHPRSPVAEAYRSIRTGIRFASVDKPIRTLVVTSAGPDEGKSTVSANLAVVMAQSGQKVLLIDADLRKPGQHKLWSLPNNLGLTNALLSSQGTIDTDKLFTATPIDNLYVMTSGQIPPNPSELLGSQKMQQIIVQLLQSFDLLIFDTPPALAVTDAAVLGQIVDAMTVVMEANATREPALIQTMQQFQKGNVHVIGFILNRFRAQRSSSYYYYYYDRYYAEDEDGKTAHTHPRHRSSEEKSWKQRLWRTGRRSS